MTIYAFPRAPLMFSIHFGSRTKSPGPKNQNFQKIKKLLGIHPYFKCAKFQTDLTIYGFPRALRMFSVNLGSPGPKNKNFQKMKNTAPGILPKCGKFQTDLTIYAFPRAKAFWSIQGPGPSPKSPNMKIFKK